MGFNEKYHLVNCYITMERSTMLLMGESTISMAIFNSFLYVYQRVYTYIYIYIFNIRIDMDLATNLLVYYRMGGAKYVAEVAFIFNLGVLNYRKLQCDSLC